MDLTHILRIKQCKWLNCVVVININYALCLCMSFFGCAQSGDKSPSTPELVAMTGSIQVST
jgi:hypothetical protein